MIGEEAATDTFLTQQEPPRMLILSERVGGCMLRRSFGILGVILALFPNRVIEWYEQVAFADRGESSPKTWLSPAIRAKGVVFIFASLTGGILYRGLLFGTGVAGILAFLFPKQYLKTGIKVAYTHSGDVVWKPLFITIARILGGCYAIAASKSILKQLNGN